MTRKRLTVLFLVALVALVVAGGALWHTLSDQTESAAAKTGRKVLYWTDPMVPGYRSDKPGKSPYMDMDLVPVYADEEPEGAPVVSVRPEIVNNLGIRTAPAARRALARSAAAQGYIVRDQRGLVLLADIFERDSDWLRPGLSAEVHAADLPGKSWQAVVERVEPDTEPGGRSVHTRLRIQNPDAALRPNLFAEALIRGQSSARLVVPREALIRTGTRTALILALGDGRFQPVEVTAGSEAGEWVEIVAGLKGGENVVVSGQFLIDAEANVRASLSRMTSEPPGTPAPANPHAGH